MLKYTQKWREKYADLPGSPQVALSQQDPPMSPTVLCSSRVFDYTCIVLWGFCSFLSFIVFVLPTQ